MTRDGSRWRPAPLLGLLAVLALDPGAAQAQAVDCTALRDAIDAAGRPGGSGSYDAAMRQQRDEITHTRSYADEVGCGDGAFDDPDAAQCRGLARRIDLLQTALRRLEDQASGGDPTADDRRRALQEQFNAACSTEGDPPPATLPVDPDRPAVPAAATRSARVLCVRHCDGAYYPLAVDVPSDRLGDMDRICQAQCPAAESSAYAGDGGEDVSDATASDGTRYAALATAFQFRKGETKACACRAPHQTWAEALAGAEALLEPYEGDVTVTAALAASMARPVPPPQRTTPARLSSPVPRKAARKAALPPIAVPAPDSDVTRQFRRSDPTL